MIRFTEDHREILEMVADFTNGELAPRAEATDEEPLFPRAALEQLAELGMLGAPVPESFGGSDGDMVLVAVIVEELARGCGATALAAASHICQVTLAVVDSGTESQKSQWLPRLADGSVYGAFAFAEHDVESDAGAMTTTATRDGDDWILDGIKKYVIGGSEAGLYLVAARTTSGTGTDDLALFIVEGGAQADGVRVLGVEDALGLRGAAFTEVAFEGCRVGGDALLGGEEKNFDAIARLLATGRIGVAAVANGVARGAAEFSQGYAAQRTAFGQTIDRFEAIRNMIADAVAGTEAGRLLTYRAATARDEGGDYTKEASMAKLLSCESAYATCKNAVQILGGNGFSREYPVERMYRDAKTLEVVEAPGELHRRIIAGAVIGAGS